MTERVTRDFTIQILRYQDSDLLTAFSDDLPGLLVPARSHAELDERLPRAVKELLEAQGGTDVSVDLEDAPAGSPKGFVSFSRKAHATLAAAA
jgi:Domain of unknown function (DUF1902)